MKIKKIAMTIALVLVTTLIAGCSAKLPNNVGTVILSVNPSIAINYDKDGFVSSVEALNDDAKAILENLDEYKDKEAKLVIADLVQLIGEAGYLIDDIENESRKITIELDDDSILPTDAFMHDLATEIRNYLNSIEHKNVIRYRENGDSDYLDFSDYFTTDYDASDYEDTDYDDSDYKEVNKETPKAPAKPTNKPTKPAKDTDYSDYSDFDDSDYGDSDYDDTDFDDSDYDDSDYDDSDYDDSDYGN